MKRLFPGIMAFYVNRLHNSRYFVASIFGRKRGIRRSPRFRGARYSVVAIAPPQSSVGHPVGVRLIADCLRRVRIDIGSSREMAASLR